MPRTKRLPGSPTAAQRAANEFYILEPVVFFYSWGNLVTWNYLRGPRSLGALAAAAARDGVSFYRAIYREFRKDHPHETAHGIAKAITDPQKGAEGFLRWWASHPDAPAVVAAREHAEFMAARTAGVGVSHPS